MSQDARMEGRSREQLVEEIERLRSELEALSRVEAERRRMEERTKHLNLVLRAIRKVNQLITKEKDRDRLLKGVCSTLTETRGYYNAWIALFDGNGRLLDWAESGLGSDFLPLVELLKKGELPRCTQTTLGQPGVVAIQDPVSACGDCPLSQKYGGRGAITARLDHGGKVYGLTAVSVPVEFVREAEEQALLGEVAADIASALHNAELEQERRKAEELTKESEEFNSSLLDNSPSPIVVINPDSSVRYVSPAFEELTGFSAAEVVGARAPYPWWTEETPHKTAEDIREIIRQGGRRLEEPFQKKSGERLWAEVNGTPVLRDGELRYYLACWLDVTERKKAEEEIRKLSEYLRSVIDNANVWLDVLDEKANVVIWNKASETISGYSRDEVVGHGKIWEWLYPDEKYRQEITARAAAIIKGDSVEDFETVIRTKGGEYRTISWHSRNLTDEAGQPIGSIALGRDITDRKKAEEKLEASRQELRELAAHIQSAREEERTGIARELHDELGQMLTAIKIDLSWLRRELSQEEAPLLEKTRALLRVADSAIKSVRRISSELRPGILDDLGLTAAIEWQAGEFEQRTGVKCEVSVEHEVMVLEQDRSTAVFRIFQEALTNVARHAGAARVGVNLSERDGRLVLEIADDGRGITAKQLSGRKSLGLLGMRERAAFLGGELEISGEPGRGTRVTVSIPLRREDGTGSQ
jgi:PAS domain S-box-containing protein